MEKINWKSKTVVDSHVHFLAAEPVPHFYKLLELVNYTGANLMAVPGPTAVQMNRDAVIRKNEHPGFFSIFGCMEHDPAKVTARDGKYLVEQIDRLMKSGCDGLKMLEGKPATRRSWMPLGLDHKYFAPYFEKAAADDLPITLHVSDPVDMWYADSGAKYFQIAPQEEFFRQAIAVLDRHPKIRINFPHFFYLSTQLDRLGELFAQFPGILVDLAMGSEFLYYLSDDPTKSRDFFIRWADRIMFGTDLSDRNSLKHGRAKAEILRRFLETDEIFVNIVDEAMGHPPGKGSNGRTELHGLNLPAEALDKVMGLNFEKWVGRKLAPLPAGATKQAAAAPAAKGAAR